MKIFRWKAVVPMLLAAAFIVVAWLLFVDVAIRRAVEFVGTELVGAKVDLASARLRLRHADLVLKGLEVTDPQQPMQNLVEMPEMVLDLNGRALLDKKAVIETLAVRGVRFGTPRRTSGALRDLPPTAGLVTRRVLSWADQIPIPSLDLGKLTGNVVRTAAVSADSLRSLQQARAMQSSADSLRRAWDAALHGLDPQPQIDSARALLAQLRGMSLSGMNAAQIATTTNNAQQTVRRLTATKDRLAAAKSSVDSGVSRMHGMAAGLDEARRADYAYARGLLHLPSLEAPDISMALFGRMATERLKPVLYWMNLAEQYVPPGLDPRRSSGPKRLRRAGVTYTFPRAHAWPLFLLQHGDADLAIGGQTAAAGTYAARIEGATTEPAIYGRPMTFAARRTSSVGPHDLSVGGMMDRTGSVPRDSVSARVPGVAFPAVAIPDANATLDLGHTLVELSLARRGSTLDGFYRVTADTVRWQRLGDTTATNAPLGSRAWAEGLLWHSIAALHNVSIAVRITGELTSPQLTVSSNVGEAVSSGLRQALGQEAQRAEADARAQVDRLVNDQVTRARGQASQLESQVAGRLGTQQEQVAQLEHDIQQEIDRLTHGVHLPGGIRLPRP